ncbi:hypothetical protein NDI85_01335 [Halomicroarcula sp. S1AR25-4]|uniref:hypothetical protein n=1 Tax=Haloarcula sp. S1AR25-4 TaxID=2950538 RepID=UPI0028744C4D|nr:hypothetical protein [Halomicroarcula sp. S1AR25-4]MDS0276445.1 hypothetical protein [Halomicroarcula sp. S1AR25-4]
MSKGHSEACGSRQTNQNKCETDTSSPDTPTDESDDRDLPSADDVLWSFIEECPDLVDVPVAFEEGTPVREDYTECVTESWDSDVLYYCGRCESSFSPSFQNPSEHVSEAHSELIDRLSVSPADAADSWVARKSVRGERVSEVEGVSWVEAVANLLESHEQTRKTTINLQYGWPRDPEYTKFSFSASDRWSPDYQREFYAQCQGWLRELTGGERPSGGETAATFDNPSVAFLTRSASSVPDDTRVGPVDHANRVRNPWREVYQKLRYVLDKLGFDSDEWQFWRVLEPHPGTGQNQCYAHEHAIIVVDGQITQSDFAPIMETHVSATEGAGLDAHTNTPCAEHADSAPNPWDAAEGACDDCDTPVSVRDPESVENLAAYVADYASIDPLDLFERSPSYIAWAAAMTAGNIRTVSRSDSARWAAIADRCRQRHESPHSDLEGEHGDRLTVSDKGTNTVECAECGSPHGIDQSRTLTDHRLNPSSGESHEILSDGGSTELWNDWIDAWRACEPTTVDRQCNHPDGSNKCPLCAEYQGAVDATVPIPDDAYVPENAFENEAVEYIERIEQKVQRHPNVGVAGLLGMLQSDLPENHAEALVRGFLAGFERPDLDDPEHQPDWLNQERVPEWRVHSIEIDGELRSASPGNGVQMTEVFTDTESWDDTEYHIGSQSGFQNPRLNDDCQSCESGHYQYEKQLSDECLSLFECDSCSDSIRVQ